MDFMVLESRKNPNSPNFKNPPVLDFEPMLKESIKRFLDQLRNGFSDFSAFGSIFFRLVQSTPDQPLEIIWFYSAVTFRGTNVSILDSLNRVLIVKDLFQLLVSCSIFCGGLKRIAVLAPVIFELCRVVKCMCLDVEKEVNREIECLMERIVSYMSICCCEKFNEDDGFVGLSGSFLDLISVWTVNEFDKSGTFCDDLRVFFPLVNNEVLGGFSGNCVVGYLAGVVMSEAFLLRLCLKFRLGLSRDEVRKEMQNWAVCSLNCFKNCHFFDSLLRMLLEPALPVTFLLNSEDEILLREVLYDVVIMVEYLFLKPEKAIQQLPSGRAVTWLFVMDSAIRFARENGDDFKAISYVNTFSESCMVARLIKWVSDQIGTDEKMSKPYASTPIALIKWLLILEDQGLRIFDCDISELHSKTIKSKARISYEAPVDNNEIKEDMGNTNREVIDFCMDTDVGRKRKEERSNGHDTQVKFFKYHL